MPAALATEAALRLTKRALEAAFLAHLEHPCESTAVTYLALFDVYEVVLLRLFAEEGIYPIPELRRGKGPAFMSVEVPGDWA